MKKKTNLKKIGILLFSVLFVGVLLVYLCDKKVDDFSHQYLYDDVTKIPYNKVGLLLGTSKKATFGGNNNYFDYRIDAAEKLIRANKIKYIIISGDNSKEIYNEPRDMKIELIERGIADSLIYLDYAGFRTFDSMVRCKEVFGQDSVTVISQRFHIERAIFIGHKNELYTIGFSAKDVSEYSGIKTKLREIFARVKLVLDVYVLNQQPKFLGAKIKVGN